MQKVSLHMRWDILWKDTYLSEEIFRFARGLASIMWPNAVECDLKLGLMGPIHLKVLEIDESCFSHKPMLEKDSVCLNIFIASPWASTAPINLSSVGTWHLPIIPGIWSDALDSRSHVQ